MGQERDEGVDANGRVKAEYILKTEYIGNVNYSNRSSLCVVRSTLSKHKTIRTFIVPISCIIQLVTRHT